MQFKQQFDQNNIRKHNTYIDRLSNQQGPNGHRIRILQVKTHRFKGKKIDNKVN